MNPNLQTIITPYGRFTVDFARDLKIGKSLSAGHHQKDIIELLKHFVTPQSIVVDIGTHIGTLAVPLARWAKKVIAFEPAPATFDLLRQNVLQNNVLVDARNKGLSRTLGKATLVEQNAVNAGAQTLAVGSGPIVLSTLDKEVETADVVKIDAEGMEFEILEGSEGLIKHSRPVVLFEVNLSQLRAHGSSPRALAAFFKRHDYALFLPVFSQQRQKLGAVKNLTLLTVCIAPHAWLLHGSSAPFDVIAIPKGKKLPLESVGFATVLMQAVGANITQKLRRFHSFVKA